MLRFCTNTLRIGAAIVLLAASAPPAAAEELRGIPALAGVPTKISGAMWVTELGPLERELEIVFSDLVSGKPVTDFEEELTQELHLIAVDSAFSTFVHAHAEKPEADGRFRVHVQLPEPGLYHVYADAVPAGYGQQVLRFDVPVGETASTTAAGQLTARRGALQSSDGAYSVELETSGLEPGVDAEVKMLIRKNGRPADDLAPYLGVPAHAVFIAASDLTYVHAHATAAAGSGERETHAGHGASSTADAVPPELTLHVTPPDPGLYNLWIQFTGGGEVRTVPFAIEVPEPKVN